MNSRDFTYYLYESDYLSAVRVVYKPSFTVLTVYYSFRTLLFKPLLKKYKYEESLIHAWYREHSKELHKDDESPYDWHFHLMLKKEDLIPFLKDLFELNDISMSELKNIQNFLNNPGEKPKNIEFKGTEDLKILSKYRKKLNQEDKYRFFFDKEKYSSIVLQLTLYLIRFDVFKFNLNPSLLETLKNIGDLTENRKLEEKEAIKNIFSKMLGRDINIEIEIDYNSKKNSEEILSNNKIIIRGEEEWQLRLILSLLRFTELDFYQVEYELGKIKLDLNNAYLEFLSTILFSVHCYYYNKHYQALSFQNYVTDRLDLELSWNFFQASKILRHLNVTKFEDVVKNNFRQKDSIILERYLVKSYFMCYSRYQKCIKFKGNINKACLLKINFLDSNFKNSMELCYDKLKLTTNKKIEGYDVFKTLRSSPFK
jgi:hypothetical protein